MELFQGKFHFDFMGRRFFFYGGSALLILASLVSFAVKGLNYGIDFTGGTVVQVAYEKPQDIRDIRRTVAALGHPDAVIQQFTGSNAFTIRLKSDEKTDASSIETFLASLQEVSKDDPFKVEQKEFVGPAVGKHLFRQAVFAIVFSLMGIIVYVAFRFSNPVWGCAGVLALAHDVTVAFGLTSILGLEVNLVLVAAVLTLAGYSINDTIVIFDRMREKMRVLRRDPLDLVINQSLNETFSRTIITALTVFITVFVLLLFGGPVIRDFALIMTVGTVIGVYSTVGVAAPIIYDWEMLGRRKGSSPAPAAEPQTKPVSAPQAPQGPKERSYRRR